MCTNSTRTNGPELFSGLLGVLFSQVLPFVEIDHDHIINKIFQDPKIQVFNGSKVKSISSLTGQAYRLKC